MCHIDRHIPKVVDMKKNTPGGCLTRQGLNRSSSAALTKSGKIGPTLNVSDNANLRFRIFDVESGN
jgi:hypothetical protein